MAEMAISLAVSAVANGLSKILFEEYALLGGGAVRHVEWIERELRSMQGLLQQIAQSTYNEQEREALDEWEDKLKEVAWEAEDVIEAFVKKSVKRWGVLYWIDKHNVGKRLQQIRRKMRHISQTGMNLNTNVVSVSVETPPGGEASPSLITSSLTNTAVTKLNHILSQNLITDDEVIEIVEQVKDGIDHLQNIMYNLKTTIEIERENVWLEEVKDVCSYTAEIAESFIARRESSSGEIKKQMKHVWTQIGDAHHRCLTYEVGGQDGIEAGDRQTIQRFSLTVPVPNLSIESLIISQIPFLIYYIVLLFLSSARVWPTSLFFLIIFDILKFASNGGRRRSTKRNNLDSILTQKKKRKGSKKKKKQVLRLLKIFSFLYLIYLVIFILSWFFPVQATFLLSMSSSLSEVVVWTVNLWMSMDNNLKCTQRYLALMRAFLNDSDSVQGLNERQKAWVGQLRVISQNGQSFIDAAAAKGKGGFLSRIKFAKDINSLLKEIIDISCRKAIYVIATIIIQQGTPTSIQEREIESVEHDDYFGTRPSPTLVASSSYRPLMGLKEKVQSIRGEKELMDALLMDAQEMGELDGRSRIWVEHLRGISLEAQSLINDYDAKLKHESFLIYVFKCWTRHVVSKKIHDVKNKIEDASRRRKAYGLKKIQTRAELSSSTVQILRGRTQPSLIAKGSNVVGFDDDAQVLIAQLLSDEQRRCISIVGIKGTGKTTLARLIFDDKTVVTHFQSRLWVEFGKEAAEQVDFDYALETLAHTKCLVVIDHMEETSQVHLDTLNKAIPNMLMGSRLLLTSRNAYASRHAAGTTNFVSPLQLLDDESSWVLFTRHLKVNIPSELEAELMKIGREIVMKCGGLPSQILKMSDLLSGKDVTVEEWSSTLWGHELNQDQRDSWSETLDTINTNLPSYLRRCLFYFRVFSAKFGIPVRRLFVLWVAEGLVHHSEEGEVPLELVAERYLTELIDKNMVQVAKRKRNGKVKTCRLPYALGQHWLEKSKESSSLRHRTATTTNSNADPKNYIIRRVAYHHDKDDILNRHIHSDRTNSTSLRTYYMYAFSFLSFDTREGSKPGKQVGNFLKECISSDCFLLLRVLDLERVYKPKLPNLIARLTQLRYLGLRWTYLESLPSTISKLLKLQTLDLKHTYIHTLPSSIWKMELRHLFLSETYRTRFPPQPKGNSLSDLQTLWGLFVDEETPLEDGFDRFINITKLGLACQSMSLNQEAMIAQLNRVADWITKLEHLQSLRLKSRDEEGKPWNLHLKSLENNVNLTDMYLLGRLSSSSILSQFPLSLIELTLSHSELAEDPMKLLKDFPKLRTLCLLAESYVGTSMVCESQSFPQLRVLKFWVLEQLEEWKIEQGALPCLRQLEIRSCPNLKMLPDGLKLVNTLLELKLTNMPVEIGADMHNILPNCQVVPQYF